METHPQNSSINFRPPTIDDGAAIFQLVQDSPPLDVNSSYLYLLQATHFANSCIVAEQNQQIVGFVSAYIRPDQPDSLFVWQIAVSETARGQGLAKRMLHALLKQVAEQQTINSLSCTISPTNLASQALFKSFAQQFQLQIKVEDFIMEQHFGVHVHEAEQLYSLSHADNQTLNSLIA